MSKTAEQIELEKIWDKECAEAYKKHPEDSNETRAWMKASLSSFSGDSWDEAYKEWKLKRK